jgi:hypothetical protein
VPYRSAIANPVFLAPKEGFAHGHRLSEAVDAANQQCAQTIRVGVLPILRWTGGSG